MERVIPERIGGIPCRRVHQAANNIAAQPSSAATGPIGLEVSEVRDVVGTLGSEPGTGVCGTGGAPGRDVP